MRRVPLFMEHAGLMVPQIGLSLAAAMLGARCDQTEGERHTCTNPAPGCPGGGDPGVHILF